MVLLTTLCCLGRRPWGPGALAMGITCAWWLSSLLDPWGTAKGQVSSFVIMLELELQDQGLFVHLPQHLGRLHPLCV